MQVKLKYDCNLSEIQTVDKEIYSVLLQKKMTCINEFIYMLNKLL